MKNIIYNQAPNGYPPVVLFVCFIVFLHSNPDLALNIEPRPSLASIDHGGAIVLLIRL